MVLTSTTHMDYHYYLNYYYYISLNNFMLYIAWEVNVMYTIQTPNYVRYILYILITHSIHMHFILHTISPHNTSYIKHHIPLSTKWIYCSEEWKGDVIVSRSFPYERTIKPLGNTSIYTNRHIG